MVIQGIVLGLLAAFCQSLCYVFSRIFVTREGNSSVLLFALSHVLMGALALVLLPWLYSAACPRLSTYVLPMLGAAFFYLAGQAALFQTLRWTEASRVSPMLGLKILILACITVMFLGKSMTGLQWAAVALGVVAAFVLNYSGGGLAWPALAGLLLCCVFYCLSDLSIGVLVNRLAPVGGFRGPALGVSMTYVINGFVGAAVLRFVSRGRASHRAWRDAAPVAITWFLAMVFLFACFRLIGVVFGNIVQSTRGLISILLGGLIAGRGLVHLERRVGAGALWRRVAAAVLMTLAIALFLLGKPVAPPPAP